MVMRQASSRSGAVAGVHSATVEQLHLAEPRVRRVHTYCSQCRSRCGVVCTVENDRLVRVEPDRRHPNGCICVKGAVAPEIVHSPDRIRRPMVRTRPKADAEPGWQEISWDDALNLVVAKLTGIKRQSGAESVVFGKASPAGSASKDYLPWLERLASAFGSPNVMGTTHICNWHRDYGASYTFGVGQPVPDIENSRCILLWGYNPHVSDMSEALRIRNAQKRGAKIIVVDPRKVGAGSSADLWLRVRPGADGALALAMIHVLLSEDLYDAAFVRDWTNGPCLVRRDTGDLLTGSDLSAAGRADSPVVWDEAHAVAKAWDGRPATDRDGVRPALFGSYRVTLADGGEVACSTSLTLLSEAAAACSPERSAAITWVPPRQVYEAARLFASRRPSCYSTFVGVEEHANATQTNRAISVFYALTGQWDTAGSNPVWQRPPTNGVRGAEFLPSEVAERRLGRRERPLGPTATGGRIVPTYEVYRAILEEEPYPVRALVMFGGNALLSNGDSLRGREALQTLDFYVQVDMFLNPSSMFADVVLPACTSWESEAVRATFDGGEATETLVQLRKAVIPPLHESRSDHRIIFDLAVRLGLGDAFWNGDVEAAFDHQLAPAGLTVRQLRERPEGIQVPLRQQPRKYALMDPATGKPRGFATPSGKVEVYSVAFARAGYPPLPTFEDPLDRFPAGVRDEFPLVLTSTKVIPFIHSSYRDIASLRRQVPEPFVEVHPDTARHLGIEPDEWVAVETPFGAVRLKAKLREWLDPRVLCTQHGWWQGCPELGLPGYDPFSAEGANINLLVGNDIADPISGSVPHRSYPCRIRKA